MTDEITTVVLENDGEPVKKALAALTAAQTRHSRARVQTAQAEAAERGAMEECLKLERDLRAMVELVAKVRGLDLAADQWSFDTETLTFHKQPRTPILRKVSPDAEQ